MHIALGALRKAAKEIHGPVTVNGLAMQLNVPSCAVRRYVNKINGLRSELNVVDEGGVRGRYMYFVTKMRDAGVMVTSDRIAKLAGCSQHAAKAWLDRNRDSVAGALIVTKFEWNRRRRVQKLRWYLRIKQFAKEPIYVTNIALALNVDRSALYRFITANNLRDEIDCARRANIE